MGNQSDEIVRYLPLREKRSTYYVEYRPPDKGCRFACLSLLFIDVVSISQIVEYMENESKKWIDRFPIPIMTSAFDNIGSLIDLSSQREQNYLISFINVETNIIEYHWNEISDDDIPDIALNNGYCLQLYGNLDKIIRSEIKNKIKENNRVNKIGIAVLITWSVVIPALILVIEFFIPNWLAAIVLFYSLLKALIKGDL